MCIWEDRRGHALSILPVHLMCTCMCVSVCDALMSVQIVTLVLFCMRMTGEAFLLVISSCVFIYCILFWESVK